MDPAIILGIFGTVIAALLGGGFWAILKIRPEAASIAVQASEHAVMGMQALLKAKLQEIAYLRAEVDALQTEVLKLRKENREFVREVEDLRDELRKALKGAGEP